MTDNSAPGIYTQPDGDADDVLGHRAADAQPDFRARDKEAAHDDDVEGHRIVTSDRAQATDDRVIYEHDTDDVEGHRVAAFDKVAAHDDEDDVEGHRASSDRVV